MSCVERIRYFFAYAKTKVQISCAVTAQLISTFDFANTLDKVKFHILLNAKFELQTRQAVLYEGTTPCVPEQEGKSKDFFILMLLMSCSIIFLNQ